MDQSLITGGQGFIGSRIVAATGGVSYDIKSGLDILDSARLEQEIAQIGARAIFHCAAKISVPESVAMPEEYYRTNVEGTLNVIRAAEKAGAKIVFSSSGAVYGEADVRVSETAPLMPKSPYAQNKADGEQALAQSGQPHIALRYLNVYGPGQSQYAGVITTFILAALKGEDLVIYGDGRQVRDFVFVEDVVQANLLAMKRANDSFELFNIGSGVETTITALAEMIVTLTRSPSKIVYQDPRPGDVKYSCADVSKAREVLGWNPETSLEQGLEKTIAHYRAQLPK